MFAIYISHPFPVIPKLLGPIQLQLPATIKTTKGNANYLTYSFFDSKGEVEAKRLRLHNRGSALSFDVRIDYEFS